jgi:hypothetical protein
VYIHIQSNEWSTLLNLNLSQYDGWVFYRIFQFFTVFFSVAILSILLRAYTIAVCYINLGALSIVNTDPLITLSKAQLEWIQTEEHLATLVLMKRKRKLSSKIGLLSRKISSSKYWRIIYYLLMIAGFILNLTM